MEWWEILKISNKWKCSIFLAVLLGIEEWSYISYAVEWLICLSCSRSVKYFLFKYLTVAFNVGQKYKKFTILRCFEKYAIFKTIYLKIEQGILIFHITVEQNTCYSFKTSWYVFGIGIQILVNLVLKYEKIDNFRDSGNDLFLDWCYYL